MGFVDALTKLPFFFRLKDQMVELARDADKVLLIDSSGFNLPLAKAIRKRYPAERDHLLYPPASMGMEEKTDTRTRKNDYETLFNPPV